MKYYAIIDGKQSGPYELSQLPDVGVRPDTYIWCQKMDEWKKAEEVAEVCRFYRQRISDGGEKKAIVEVNQDATKEVADADIPVRFGGIIQKMNEKPDPLPDMANYDEEPRTMLTEAIIATILCCPLTGIVAIYSASQVARLWKQGEKEAAHDASRRAKMWTGITFFMGFLTYAFFAKYFAIV